jgi:hypothetical protein
MGDAIKNDSPIYLLRGVTDLGQERFHALFVYAFFTPPGEKSIYKKQKTPANTIQERID